MIPVPVGREGLDATLGAFTYHELSGGNVQIDGSWEMDNIVTLRDACGTGLTIRLHRLVAEHFLESLAAAMAAAPKYRVRMLGGFDARHKMHDPRRSLSVHSWGAAWDVNWDRNPVSKKLVTDLPTEFIEQLTARGWEWGGGWRSPKDAMHFQYASGV